MPQASKLLWEPERSWIGFPAGAAQAVARSIGVTGYACLLPARGETGQGAVVRTPKGWNLAPPGIDVELEAGFANLQHPQAVAQAVPTGPAAPAASTVVRG